MIRHNFQGASVQGDWTMPYIINCSQLVGAGGWTGDHLVELNISPDRDPGWDDYGLRRYGPTPDPYVQPWAYQTRSDDGSGIVQLVPPASVQVVVPASVLGRFGPGMVSLGVHFTRLSTGQRITLLAGRLPIVSVP